MNGNAEIKKIALLIKGKKKLSMNRAGMMLEISNTSIIPFVGK